MLPRYRLLLMMTLLLVTGLSIASAKNRYNKVEEVLRSFTASQQDVVERWRYRPNIMCDSAAVHGIMNKTTTGATTLGVKGIAQYIESKVPIYAGAQVCHPYNPIACLMFQLLQWSWLVTPRTWQGKNQKQYSIGNCRL